MYWVNSLAFSLNWLLIKRIFIFYNNKTRQQLLNFQWEITLQSKTTIQRIDADTSTFYIWFPAGQKLNNLFKSKKLINIYIFLLTVSFCFYHPKQSLRLSSRVKLGRLVKFHNYNAIFEIQTQKSRKMTSWNGNQ